MTQTHSLTDLLPKSNLSRAPGRRPTQEERDRERVERMIVAAFELYTARGYHNTTIEMLCTTANVSTRDFYKLIKSQDVLLLKVYERVSEHVEDCVRVALDNAPDELNARLRLAVEAWVYAYTQDPRYARLAYIEIVGASDEIERKRRWYHDHFAALITREFERRDIDVSSTMHGRLPLAIVGACNELVVDWLAQSPQPAPQQLAEQILQLYQLLFTGLKA